MISRQRILATLFVLGLTLGAGLALSVAHAKANSTNVMVGVKQNMHAILIAPDSGGPYPGILLLHTSGGLRQDEIDYGQRLSQP